MNSNLTRRGFLTTTAGGLSLAGTCPAFGAGSAATDGTYPYLAEGYVDGKGVVVS